MNNIEDKSGTYTITNRENGKVYYGSSSNIDRRWKEHRKALRRGEHGNPHLQRSWNKYGPASFTFAVFDYCDVEDLHAYEQILLDQHAGKDYCYNIAKDAVSPMRGRKHSEETKRKVSQALLGKTHSEETKRKMRKPKHSEEYRRKLSQVMKGENNPMYGKTLSEEAKQKISEVKKGKTHSEETKQKMRKPKPKLTCPHCNKTGGGNVMYRYHFDNCKHRQDQ